MASNWKYMTVKLTRKEYRAIELEASEKKIPITTMVRSYIESRLEMLVDKHKERLETM